MTEPVDCDQLLITTNAICAAHGEESTECAAARGLYKLLCGGQGPQSMEEIEAGMALADKLAGLQLDRIALERNRVLVRLELFKANLKS